MADKIFVGNCKPGKFPEQIEVGFSRENLELLTSHLNEKGWVNCRLNKGRDSGKPYMEIVTFTPSSAPSSVRSVPSAGSVHLETGEDLPF